MPDNVSVRLFVLQNFRNLVKHHKDNCKDENCSLSLYYLLMIAEMWHDNHIFSYAEHPKVEEVMKEIVELCK